MIPEYYSFFIVVVLCVKFMYKSKLETNIELKKNIFCNFIKYFIFLVQFGFP